MREARGDTTHLFKATDKSINNFVHGVESSTSGFTKSVGAEVGELENDAASALHSAEEKTNESVQIIENKINGDQKYMHKADKIERRDEHRLEHKDEKIEHKIEHRIR